MRDRHPADDPDGALAALRHGPDRGAVQVRVLRRAALHPDAVPAQAGRTAEPAGRPGVHQHKVRRDLRLVVRLDYPYGGTDLERSFFFFPRRCFATV